MSNLLRILLDGSHPGPLEENPDRRHRRSHKPSVITNLQEAARFHHTLTLSEYEVKTLVKMLEGQMVDPFASGTSVLDDGDLKALGVESNGTGDKYGLRDHGDVPRQIEDGSKPDLGELSNKQPLFGPESALMAPDCTPGGRDDIPSSVIHSMKVLSGDDEEREYTQSSQSPPQSPAPREPHQYSQEPQRRASQQPPVQAQESVASLIRTTKALREGSSKHNRRVVRKKNLTPEQQSAISALGGPSDPLG